MTSLADFIGDGPYVMGERPTTYDATAYAFAALIVQAEFTCPVREQAKQHESLLGYLERVRERHLARSTR